MTMGILRRFLNPAAPNPKSFGLRRFLAASEIDEGLGRKAILMGIASFLVYLADEVVVTRPRAMALRRYLVEDLPEVNKLIESQREHSERYKRGAEEAAKKQKLLLEELEELKEKLKRG